MKIKKYNLPLITFGVLFVTSFVPVIQIILMYWNGGILATIEMISGIDAMELAIPLNLILTILCLYFYFKSKKAGYKVLFSIISFFFINGLTVFSFSKILGNDDSDYYFIQFMLVAFVTGFSLIGIDYLKYKTELKASA